MDKEQLLADWWKRWREQDFTWEGLKKHLWEGWFVVEGSDGQKYLVEAQTRRRYGAPIPENPDEADVPEEDCAPDNPRGGEDATLQDYWRADPETGRWRNDEDVEAELVRTDGLPTYHRAHLPIHYEDGTPTGKRHWEDDALDTLTNVRLRAAGNTKIRIGVRPDGSIGFVASGADRRTQLQGSVWLSAAAHRDDAATPLWLRYDFAHFARYAVFRSASFAGDAFFQSASFAGDARFESASFAGFASFESASFAGDARFESASFAGHAWFRSASFAGDARFKSASFAREAWFHHASFVGDADFSLGNPQARPAGQTEAEGREKDDEGTFDQKVAEFAGKLTLDHSAFIREQYGFNRISFDDAQFWGPVSFVNRLFKDETSFKRAQFFDGASFHGATLHEKTFFKNAKFSSGFGSAPDEIPENLPEASRPAFEEALNERKALIEKRRTDRDARHNAATDLEADFRRLKIEMENLRDRTAEQDFFALEIEARQKLTKDVTPWEKGFAWLFKVTSDYGRKISWPLFWVLGTFGAFLVIYMFVALFFVPIERAEGMSGPLTQPESFGHLWNAITRAAAVSLERTMVPVIGQDYDVHRWLEDFAKSMPLTSTILGLSHRFVATALLFLLLLSIRRRFQIN